MSSLNPIAAAAGRILQPDYADLVFAQHAGNSSEIEVHFRGKSSFPAVRIPYLADPGSGSRDIDNIAIATGDLDQALDAIDNYHDEVAVAYSSKSKGEYKVSVLNYTNASASLRPDLASIAVEQDDSANSFLISRDVPIGVAVGDVNGDGKNELIVATIRKGRIYVTVYRYTFDGNLGHSEQMVKFELPFTTLLPDPGGSNYYFVSKAQKAISVQVADVNGDGRDEILLGYVLSGAGYGNASSTLFNTPVLSVIKLDGSSKLEDSVDNYERAYVGGNTQAPPPVRAQIATGQFLYNPGAGIPFGQHQIAIAWNDLYNHAIAIHAYSVPSHELKPQPIGSLAYALDPSISGVTSQQFSFVAGGFTGNAHVERPTAQLAVSGWSWSSLYEGQFWTHTIEVKPNGLSFADFRSVPTRGPNTQYRLPLVATDWDGKSLYLGAPAHIIVENPVSTDYIIQALPKHSYWDPFLQVPENVDISNYDSNVVVFSNKNGSSSESTDTDRSNQTVGGSTEASAGATVSNSTNALLVKTSVSVSADVTTRASYEYDTIKEGYDSQAESRTYTVQSSTDFDDYYREPFS